MIIYLHEDKDIRRKEIEKVVGEDFVSAAVELAVKHPNELQEFKVGKYAFAVISELPDFTPLEEIGLHFVGEKFGLYQFQYTGYDEFFVVARPWDYHFFRRHRVMHEDEMGTYVAIGFSVEEAEAVGKFFDLNFPGLWRKPYELPDNEPRGYELAMEEEYGDEAWGWNHENDSNVYIR